MLQRKHLTMEGLRETVAIRASMNQGLPDKLKTAFPDITPQDRSVVTNQEIPDPNWLAGFTAGEGCLYVNFGQNSNYKTGFQVQLKFIITQHSRDKQLMVNIVNYLDCGYI